MKLLIVILSLVVLSAQARKINLKDFVDGFVNYRLENIDDKAPDALNNSCVLQLSDSGYGNYLHVIIPKELDLCKLPRYQVVSKRSSVSISMFKPQKIEASDEISRYLAAKIPDTNLSSAKKIYKIAKNPTMTTAVHRFQNKNFNRLKKIFDKLEMDELFGNCGTTISNKVIKASHTSRTGISLMAQNLGLGLANEATINVANRTQSKNFLDNFELSHLGDDRARLKEVERIKKSFKSVVNRLGKNANLKFYLANLQGRFDDGISFLLIHDSKRNEVVGYGDGYCE